MSPSRQAKSNAEAANRAANPASATPSLPASNASKTSPAPALSGWSSQTSALPSQNGPSASFGQFSAATAEILNRIRANPGNSLGTPAFEAKRAEVLQSYVTSDKLPTPPPIANTGKRGRGGRTGTPSQLKTEVGGATPASGATPTSARGSGRGRGRGGRGRGGGKGGKRKRSESFDDSDENSDISDSYTPLPTKTKSGRNVNKPVAFVPTIPEPTPGVKRRRSTKTLLAAQCKICHRATEPGNNRIVFCDVCSTAYHQYCHDPPIENEVVNVLEKEWLCGPCERSKQIVVEGTEGLIAGDNISIEDKRAYLSTLPHTRLVSLLLHSVIRHPELPLFPPNLQDLIPDLPKTKSTAPHHSASTPAAKPLSTSITSPPTNNGVNSTGHTPRSQNQATDSSEMDPAEAQLLGEISRYHPSYSPSKPSLPGASNSNANTAAGAVGNADTAMQDEYDDGYDTDPPAHYPKPGNGLARTMRPESEDLEWMVDDNFEVFSHGWKGDGTGVGADGGLDDVMDGKGR